MLQLPGQYQSSQHSEKDFNSWRGTTLSCLGNIKAELINEMARDAQEKTEAMEALNKALDKLEDEGEFAKKLTRFTSAWGRDKLGQDLLKQVKEHRDRVAKDMEE